MVRRRGEVVLAEAVGIVGDPRALVPGAGMVTDAESLTAFYENAIARRRAGVR